jgi:hypothetical protein
MEVDNGESDEKLSIHFSFDYEHVNLIEFVHAKLICISACICIPIVPHEKQNIVYLVYLYCVSN